MISFMVIAGERSGSTWAANWLTTATQHCVHDPLYRYRLDQLDDLHFGTKRVGLSCTALAYVAPGWLDKHQARKVIIHRPEEEIAASWSKCGVDKHIGGTEERLNKIEGFHVDFQSLFDPAHARVISEYLGVPFDAVRHYELLQMNVQPHWAAVKIEKQPVTQLIERIRSKLAEA